MAGYDKSYAKFQEDLGAASALAFELRIMAVSALIKLTEALRLQGHMQFLSAVTHFRDGETSFKLRSEAVPKSKSTALAIHQGGNPPPAKRARSTEVVKVMQTLSRYGCLLRQVDSGAVIHLHSDVLTTPQDIASCTGEVVYSCQKTMSS